MTVTAKGAFGAVYIIREAASGGSVSRAVLAFKGHMLFYVFLGYGGLFYIIKRSFHVSFIPIS